MAGAVPRGTELLIAISCRQLITYSDAKPMCDASRSPVGDRRVRRAGRYAELAASRIPTEMGSDPI